MPRKTTASPKKATKKKAPAIPKGHRSTAKKAEPVSSHSKKEGGGLGVVIVLLVGILIIGAMFIAIQNSKTTELEKEVTMLTGELEGKFAELNDEIASTKEEQEKQKEQVTQLSQKTYKSGNELFSFMYPVEVSVQELAGDSFENLADIPVQMYASPNGVPVEEENPHFVVYVFENEEGLSLPDWLLQNSEDNTGLLEDTEQSEKVYGDNTFLTYYTDTNGGSSHFYVNTDTHILTVRTSGTLTPEIENALTKVLTTLEF